MLKADAPPNKASKEKSGKGTYPKVFSKLTRQKAYYGKEFDERFNDMDSKPASFAKERVQIAEALSSKDAAPSNEPADSTPPCQYK